MKKMSDELFIVGDNIIVIVDELVRVLREYEIVMKIRLGEINEV